MLRCSCAKSIFHLLQMCYIVVKVSNIGLGFHGFNHHLIHHVIGRGWPLQRAVDAHCLTVAHRASVTFRLNGLGCNNRRLKD